MGSLLLLLSPLLCFFLIWFFRVWNDPVEANFTNTMWLNFLSAFCLNAFFVWFFLETSHILQL
jgi:1,4-dihydroxy-2-naphthoate octaprenyltransferase